MRRTDLTLAALLLTSAVSGAWAQTLTTDELLELRLEAIDARAEVIDRVAEVIDRIGVKDRLIGEDSLVLEDLLDPLVLESREAASIAASRDPGEILQCIFRYFRAVERCAEQLSRCHRQTQNQRQKELCFHSFLGCLDVATQHLC